jgi:hypothetical protein
MAKLKEGVTEMDAGTLAQRAADMRERLSRGPSWQYGDMSWMDLGTQPSDTRRAMERTEQMSRWYKHAAALVRYAERVGYGQNN